MLEMNFWALDYVGNKKHTKCKRSFLVMKITRSGNKCKPPQIILQYKPPIGKEIYINLFLNAHALCLLSGKNRS